MKKLTACRVDAMLLLQQGCNKTILCEKGFIQHGLGDQKQAGNLNSITQYGQIFTCASQVRAIVLLSSRLDSQEAPELICMM